MPMFCPMCGGPARFVDIQMDTQSIRCRFCNAEYSVAQLVNEQGRPEDPRKHKEIRLPRPGSITLQSDPLELVIHRKWPKVEGYAFIGFGAFWCLMILMTLSESGFLGVLFSVVGVYIIVQGVYNIVNTTTFRVTRSKLEVRHHPLPARNKTFDMNGVEQLFVKQHIRQTRSKSGTRTTISYSLEKVTDQGRFVTVQHNLNDDEALFIEQEIERWLRIENLPVRGEYGRGAFA